MRDPLTSCRRARGPRRAGSFRPQLLALEDRLPPGDAVLGAFLGAALFGPGLLLVAPGAGPAEGVTDMAISAAHGSGRPAPLSVVSPPGRARLAPELLTTSCALGTDQPEARDQPRHLGSESDGPPFLGAASLFALDEAVLAAGLPGSRGATGAPPAPGVSRRILTAGGLAGARGGAVAPGVIVEAAPPPSEWVPASPDAPPDGGPSPAADTKPDKARVRESYGRLPMSFEANQGQADAPVQFLARGLGYALSLTPTGATLTLANAAAAPTAEAAVVRMQVLGGNPAPRVTAQNPLPGTVNYLRGQDSARWLTGVPTYARVHYAGVYPGVDLVYYGNQQRLEYDFVVAPGADPDLIALAFAGAGRVEVDARGDLVLHAAGGEVRQPRPFLYQEVGGVRLEVSGGYVLDDQQQVRFEVGAYDTSRPLVIDPVLAYSSYLGGPGYPWSGDKDAGNDIAVDAAGNIYVAGATNSIGRWDADAYVAKFDPTGSTLLYATFLDGNGWDDSANGLAVDAAGNAYVTGGLENLGVFAAKLGYAGSPHYFVYFGAGPVGYRTDTGTAVAVDGAGNAYVTGRTDFWGDFPTTGGAFQPAFGGGLGDAFVVKLNGRGAIVYSTYLGGTAWDYGMDIAVDAAGSAYVTGRTDAADFPTTWGAFQPASGGSSDAFVTKGNPWGTALVYSSYLGGADAEQGNGLALDAAGRAYVTGLTASLDFPTTWGSFQPTFGGGSSDAFVTKVNAAGSALVYSSYLGGSNLWLGDRGHGIAVDAGGNAYVTGYTIAFDFPTVAPVQPFLAGLSDAFVTKVNAAGTALVYSTYLGGRQSDHGNGLAVGAAGNVYVVGVTGSADFPTTWGAYQPTHGGGSDSPYGSSDAFVARIAG